MKLLTSTLAGVTLLGTATLTQAADNPLSVHVLNIQNGKPTGGVEVILEKKIDSGWETLNQATTEEDSGRISALFPEDKEFTEGVYRVTFETGDYFDAQGTDTFFPEIPVPFKVESTDQHYHIPLLLSPYGYFTYRGN
ncbi:hydroxyisourate hydrolase [Pistricoccus aurantiacus]|uniref:5-hydroxyisourate hydrolase n=1 Tax=Pistricoccus aurantiacus TaxID=1883414 RepID=A0A5B8SMG8_9GAMM|nr:hydroxyisourate hydrolase [Pistricoccus aurantiacus]QEA38279.1 hydroxyisourate hydrolase [Pistricoccus aurantiacus]